MKRLPDLTMPLSVYPSAQELLSAMRLQELLCRFIRRYILAVHYGYRQCTDNTVDVLGKKIFKRLKAAPFSGAKT